MAKNDIFVNFPFFRFANQWKKRKNGIYLCAVFAFLCFRFQSKTKKTKKWNLFYWIFYFSIFRSKPKNWKIEICFTRIPIFQFLQKMVKTVTDVSSQNAIAVLTRDQRFPAKLKSCAWGTRVHEEEINYGYPPF